jgi:hypothetical protein
MQRREDVRFAYSRSGHQHPPFRAPRADSRQRRNPLFGEGMASLCFAGLSTLESASANMASYERVVGHLHYLLILMVWVSRNLIPSGQSYLIPISVDRLWLIGELI